MGCRDFGYEGDNSLAVRMAAEQAARRDREEASKATTRVEFLLTRIVEDEAVAEQSISRNQFGDIISWHGYRHGVSPAVLPRGAVAVPAPGFLTECKAKRQIVERWVHQAEVRLQVDLIQTHGWWTLGYLALPYADHPDYREEWRP
jgi:hypothetical protein